MTWSDFYLLCFLVGFSLSVLSFLAGAVHIHLPFKMHLPFHGGHHAGGVHAGHSGGTGARGGASKGGAHLSWFNASTVMAFLAWFGGVGYILSAHSRVVGPLVLAIAFTAGVASSWVVFRFMVKLMNQEGSFLKEEDYRHEGCVGTVTVSIREKGTGEVVFLQGGVRKSAGARSQDGAVLEKGAEVVIEKYEDGIAYVRRWEEFSK
jgi:membrane protein implicated in regulation of membrane protease activity